MSSSAKPSNNKANRSMPPGVIIPELIYDDLNAAVTWLCEAFGFRERLRIGNHRTQLTFGGASVIAIAGNPEQHQRRGERAHSIMVRVEAVDPHYEHAKRSGARITSPPDDYPYGERQYTAEDIGGHLWTFSQSVADVDPAEWGGVLVKSASEPG